MSRLRSGLIVLCGAGLATLSFPALAQSQAPGNANSIERRPQSEVLDPNDFSERPGAYQATQQTEVSPTDNYVPDEIRNSQDAEGEGRESMQERASRGPARLQPPSEFEEFVSDMVGRDLRRFGSELFLPDNPTFTGPPTTAIPLDYRIHPGDELIVGLTGSVQGSNLRLVVDQDGRIFIPRVGAVRVAGVRYGDLQATLAEQVARQYRDFRVSVTIGSLRGITIHVTGFASVPGTYTVSGLSTLVNAVISANGPAPGGSLRSVQLRREGQLIADLDFYDFLQRGDTGQDIALQDGDVITFAPAGSQFAVIGSVNREGIYEARADDTLNDALLYAGGANTVADLSRLHLLNPSGNSGWQEVVPEVLGTQMVTRGAILRVLSAVGIAQPVARLQSLVTISGEVERPGRYFVAHGTPLEQVIEMAGGLTPQAYTFGSVFIRDKLRREQQEAYDRVVNEVRINLLAEPLSAADTQDASLDFRISAINELFERLQARELNGRVVISELSPGTPLNASFIVENNDELYVPPQPLTVGVYGLVNNQSDYIYRHGMTVREYIQSAGGLNRYADRGEIFVLRANGSVLGGRSVERAAALPGDVIFVPVASNRGVLWSILREALVNVLPSTLSTAIVVSATN